MTRGLHPHTRPQRAKAGEERWEEPAGGEAVERRDAPPRKVAAVLAGVFVTLLLCMAGVAVLMRTIEKRAPIGAATAEARFQSPAPSLLPEPEQALRAVERLHAAPPEATLERAMREVARDGWDETRPPPGRAETALDRAEAAR